MITASVSRWVDGRWVGRLVGKWLMNIIKPLILEQFRKTQEVVSLPKPLSSKPMHAKVDTVIRKEKFSILFFHSFYAQKFYKKKQYQQHNF